MARELGPDVSCFIQTDKDGNPNGSVIWKYSVRDGDAKKRASWIDTKPDYAKTYHSKGTVGEFWRDAMDTIKANEGIS